MIRQLSYILFFLAAIPAIAQTASNVTTKVDRDSIMMGEEIKLQITVDATPEDLVIFPIQQAVGVLEVIEDAGHSPTLECPEQTTDALRRWLNAPLVLR